LSSEQSIPRQLFSLAAPIIGINVLNVLMLAVDSALCGRLPESEAALKALGFAVQIIFLLMVAMLGLLVGTVALVARAYGGRDTARLNHLLVQSTLLTAIVGVIVGVLGAVFAGPILRGLGASSSVAELGVAYLRPLMIGTPFFYLTLLYTGVLRGVGNTKFPFTCALVANVVNAVLNYGLVLGNLGMPAMGVTGSAIGTVVAQFLNMAMLVWVLRRGSIADLRLPIRIARIDRSLAVELYRIGWPAAIDMLVLNAGFLTALGMLGRIDEDTVAAHGLGLRVQALAFVPGLSIAQATGALVGQALGAGDVPRAKQVVRASILLCFAIMCALALAIIATAQWLVAIFDVKAGSPIATFSIEWMRILGVAMLPASLQIALIGLLQGSGATRTSLRINVWTTLGIQVPLALVLAFPLGFEEAGVWWSFPLAFVAKAALCYGAYRSGTWAVTGVRVAPPVGGAEH
jgi:putative MATE family efflux protein